MSLGACRTVDLPKSTVQRIIAALDFENFVVSAFLTAPAAGPAWSGLPIPFDSRLPNCRPYLQELSEKG
jgi:hypothetical protein